MSAAPLEVVPNVIELVPAEDFDDVRAERDRLRAALVELRERMDSALESLPASRLISRNTAAGHLLLLAGHVDDVLGA